MELALEIPEGWQLEQAPEGRRRLRMAADAPVFVDVLPLVAIPEPIRDWREQQATFELPAGSRPRWGAEQKLRSAVGWPVKLLDLVATVNDEPVEYRLALCFHFIAHGAVAVIRAPREEDLAASRDALVEVLLRGRPDWSGSVICLSELLS